MTNTRSDRFWTPNSPKDVLKAIATRAIGIRKLLRQAEGQLDQRVRRETDDVVQVAQTIEALASSGADLPAADAINRVEMLEILLEVLEKRLARILAFEAGVR